MPYQIPIGGATPVGALGYIDAADEIVEQLGEVPALTITADGSGGTHAGLVAGFGDHACVVGFDVGTRPDLDEVVPREADGGGGVVRSRAAPVGDVRVDHDYFGADYGAPTDAAREALHLFATNEGLAARPRLQRQGRGGPRGLRPHRSVARRGRSCSCTPAACRRCSPTPSPSGCASRSRR